MYWLLHGKGELVGFCEIVLLAVGTLVFMSCMLTVLSVLFCEFGLDACPSVCLVLWVLDAVGAWL
jgi:hypothetical protein